MLKADYSLKYLAEGINNMVFGYESSLNGQMLLNAIMEEEALAKWIHGLLDDERKEVLKLLTENGLRNYNYYFKLI
jgi:hypothetical protein